MEEKNNSRENLEKGKNNKTLIIVLVVLGIILLIGIVFSVINRNVNSNKNNNGNNKDNDVVDKDKDKTNDNRSNEEIKDNNEVILEKYSVNNDEDFIKYLNKTSEALTKYNTYTVEYNKLKYVFNKKEIGETNKTVGYTYDIYYDGEKISFNNNYNDDDNYILSNMKAYLLQDGVLTVSLNVPVTEIYKYDVKAINFNGEVLFDKEVEKYEYNNDILSYSINSKEYENIMMSETNDKKCKYISKNFNDDNYAVKGTYKYKYQNGKFDLIEKEETTIKDLKDKYNCN